MSTLIQAASIDSHISGVQTANNFGSAVSLLIRVQRFGGVKVALERTIINFDLSSIPPGSTINSAEMRFEVWFVEASAGVKFERCTRPSTWVESQVTWIVYSTGNNWTAAGGDKDTGTTVTDTFPSGTGTWAIATSAQLVSLVQDAIDNRSGILSLIGFLTDESDSGSSRGGAMRSTEYDSGSAAPEIEVDYTAPASLIYQPRSALAHALVR